jgi:hypothetical protein
MSDLEIPRAVFRENVRWGGVSYHGRCHAPTPGTYSGIDPMRITYTTRADSGIRLDTRGLRLLHPLIAAAIYEHSFCEEAGPLLTWLN